MFEFPSTRPFLSLEPWSPDYGSAIDLGDEEPAEETPYRIDTTVETEDWSQGIVPAALPMPASIAFVDGVQRIESWARLDDGETLADAALASVAAGATISEDGVSRIEFGRPKRVLAVAGPVAAQPVVILTKSTDLVFEVQRSEQLGKHSVAQAIAIARRDLEHIWLEKLADACPLVIADGRLDRPPSTRNRLIGLAKTLHQLYVPVGPRALISRLASGKRTPVFLIEDDWGARYSWFLRLPYTRPIHHSFAGIVRLETVDVERHQVAAVADMVSHNLPRFASRPEHDPRAPQNLLPVGALEKRLRHEMGDSLFIRRAIEDHLYQAMRP